MLVVVVVYRDKWKKARGRASLSCSYWVENVWETIVENMVITILG